MQVTDVTVTKPSESSSSTTSFFFFQAEDGIRDYKVTGVQTCALPIYHGKSVFEAQRLGDFEMKAIGVELLDAVVDRGRIARRSFVEDSGERGAGVLNIEIEVAGFEGFVDEERAAEVGLAHDGDSRASFDVLGEEFRKDDLLGEKLGADSDSGRTRRMARGKTKRDGSDQNEKGAAHIRRLSGGARGGRGGGPRGWREERRGWRQRG